MALAAREIEIVRETGFAVELAHRIRAQTESLIERWETWSIDDRRVSHRALSVAVADGEEAERLMKALQPDLQKEECKAFWTMRLKSNGQRITDEIAILKTDDSDAIVRLCHTGGENYGVSNADILSRLEAWRQICDLQVVGASRDWVAMQFVRLPERVCDFAVEVYQFCPDSVDQGVGLIREKDEPELFVAARGLCPEVSFKAPANEMTIPETTGQSAQQREEIMKLLAHLKANSTPVETGIRLLAHKIATEKYLFLWWD